MAVAYPSVAMQANLEALNSARVDVSDSGRVRIVSLGEQAAYRIKITHPYVTPSDMATLQAFHATNQANAIRITVHGQDYDAYFAGPYSFDVRTGVYSEGSVVMVGEPV